MNERDLILRIRCPECRAAAKVRLEAIELAEVTHRILRSASNPSVAFAAITGIVEALAKDAGRQPIDVARDLVKSFE